MKGFFRTSKQSTPQPPEQQSEKSAKPRKASGANKKPTAPSWSLAQFQVPPEEGKTRFHDFTLPDTLMHAICQQGFRYCTPIQAHILECALSGADAIGKAQTGTGKTAAFLISVISQLITRKPPETRYLGEPRALIIAPTRELALQITKDARALTQYSGLAVASVIGGMDPIKQLQELHQHYVDIVVATPGRLLDYLERKELHLDLVESLVIDEADMMLDMGFIPQVRRILHATPRPGDRQTLLFSATFTDSIMNLSTQWTWQPTTVDVAPERVGADTVEQHVYILSNREKYRLLKNLIQQQHQQRMIIFTNRRDQARKLHEKLCADQIQAGLLSGEVAQEKRIKTLENLRSGNLQVLVATDVAGRGIHINDIQYVINYHLPEDPEDYIHRIGRTGRAGAQGTSISFASEDDAFQIPMLEERLGMKITCTPPPPELLV